MPTCYVVGCTSGYRINPEQRKFFSPRSEKERILWEKVIPRKESLCKTARVCDKHFEDSYIIKGEMMILPDGPTFVLSGKWKKKTILLALETLSFVLSAIEAFI